MQFLLVASAALAVAAAQTYTCPDQNDSCLYPPGCNANVAIDNAGFDYNESPFYDQVITESFDHDDTDCSCSTFFRCGGKTLIWLRTVTYKNGTYYVHRLFVGPIEGTPGAYRGQGLRQETGCDTCVFNDYFLGQPCPKSWVFYRCYMYGVCKERYAGRDTLFGFSSMESVSQECKEKMVTLGTTDNPGLDSSGAIYLPNTLPNRCVVSINNMTCINYERVPCQNRLYI